MLDPVRIEAHTLHFGPRSAIVRRAHRVIQQKFGATFRAVDFDR